MRIEKFGKATLYNGDNLEVVKLLGRFDAVITDPPYGIDLGKVFSTGLGDNSVPDVFNKGKKGAGKEYTTQSGAAKTIDNRGDTLKRNLATKDKEWDDQRPGREIFDWMRANSDYQMIWGGNYFTDYLPIAWQWIIWNKRLGSKLGSDGEIQKGFSLAHFEMCWSSQLKASRMLDFSNSKDLAAEGHRKHTSQKPVEVMKFCFDTLPKIPNTQTPAIKSVIDMFMGTGTTGVAAASWPSIEFVGIEREPDYFDICCERISKAYQQPVDMFAM